MIIDNEIPSMKVYEDENFIAFLDIEPKQKGHTLIVPKVKNENILSESDFVKENILKIAVDLSNKLKKKLGATGIQMVMNNGKDAGQVVFHTHIHLIPYYNKKTPSINNEEVLNKILN